MSSRLKRWSGLLRRHSRLLLSGATIIVLAWWVDLDAMGRLVTGVDPLLFAGVVGLLVAGHLLNAWKLRILLGSGGIRLSHLVATNLVGAFFYNVFVGLLSGEAFRIYSLKKEGATLSTAAAVVVVDRMTGFSTQCLVAFVGAGVIFLGKPSSASTAIILAGALAAATLVMSGTILLYSGRTGIAAALVRRLVGAAAAEGTEDLLASIAAMRRVIAPTAVVSLLYHATTIAAIVVPVQALGGSISILEASIVSAGAAFVGVVPLSANGWGLTEALYAITFGYYHAGKELGLSASLVMRAAIILPSVLAWIWYVARRAKAREPHSGLPGSPS